jgi:DNA-binding transcriptional ArsR family regulator
MARVKAITDIDDPRYVKAMSHPLRVRILAMLDERMASPNQLAGWLGATLGTTAYHVRVLEQLGLIELADETRVRGAVEHHYRATGRPMVSAQAWAGVTQIAKQAAVGSSLAIIDEYAQASGASGGFDRAEAHLSRTRVKLDSKGWEQLMGATLKYVEKVESIERAALARMEKKPHAEEPSEATVVVMNFEGARLTDQPERPARRGRAGSPLMTAQRV